MLYNLLFKTQFDSYNIMGISEDKLQKVINAYKRGLEEFTLSGKKYWMGNLHEIQIFTHTKETDPLTFLRKCIADGHCYSTVGGSQYISAKELSFVGDNITEDIIGDMGFGEENNSSSVQISSRNDDVKIEKGRIFISHSSKDIELVKNFIERILILGLGIKSGNIFCTSVQGMNIKSGADFKKAIFTELTSAETVIQIITKNYKVSEVCLNEMGAAWALSQNVIPFVGHPFNYDVGFIHASTQQLRLNSQEDLLRFYDDHKGKIFTLEVNMANYLNQIAEFLKYQIDFYKFEKEEEINFFYDRTNSLKGKLKKGIFGHPPAESFKEHISYHNFYYLELKTPINVLNRKLLLEEGDCDVSHFDVKTIHIVPQTDSIELELRDFENQNVIVKGNLWGGHTAWHQSPVMMSFTDISLF